MNIISNMLKTLEIISITIVMALEIFMAVPVAVNEVRMEQSSENGK